LEGEVHEILEIEITTAEETLLHEPVWVRRVARRMPWEPILPGDILDMEIVSENVSYRYVKG